ncbi:MAG TPA: non-heme iron oxygenase ferredoxin subunit [Mycobacteriales bacterium]|jgi:3-phenylpropionate/trans-cinnamate dioxygenase ferredoxin subunit|nr:non-heme iron oxygenase ferredoxin subunit [Mycobacteriales bacterium]
MGEWVRAASLSAIEEDRAVHVEVDGTAVCLARSLGCVFAVHDRCTHADVPLSEGEVEDGLVECWLHGSQFDLRTGEPISLPATVPVATYAVKTEGDDIYVDVRTPANAALAVEEN